MKALLIGFIIAFESFVLSALWMSWSEARTASFEAGMANTKVKALKEQVNVQAVALQNSKSDIRALNDTIGQYSTSINHLENQVYEYTGQIEALRLEIQEMKKPVVVMPPSKPKKGKR